MGELPQRRGITIDFECQFGVHLQKSDFSSIMMAFLLLLPQLLEDFFQKVLVGFGEYEMGMKKKSFACKCCGNDSKFIWKTRHGKATVILTCFRWITLNQLQVQCKQCGSKQYITRTLLGMEPMKRVPDETRPKLQGR
jgi:Zn finger protein HypA/HybF involved in hydrogenase expression